MAEIIIVGGINIDIEGVPYRELTECDSNPGTVKVSCGGVGRNIAENVARIGMDCAMLSAIGSDELGRGAKAQLARLGLDTSLIREIPGKHSAIYMSILGPERDMQLALCDMEIINELGAADLAAACAKFPEAKAVALDGNLNEDLLREATEIFAAKSLFYDPVSANKAERAKTHIGRFHSIKPNLIEAEVLLDMKIRDDEDIRTAARIFLEKGIKNVYITRGSRGVYFRSSEKEGFIKPPDCIKIESATGAGDAFSAMILYGMARDLPIEEVASLGMAASLIAMESEKAVNDKLSIEEIKRRANNNV